MPKANDPKNPRMLLARRRERQVMELRSRGVDVRDIAEQLQMSERGVRASLDRALKRMSDPIDMESRRALYLRRIEMRRQAAAGILARSHPIFHNGRLVHDDDGRTVDDDAVKLAALDRLRHADHDEAKLFGLDAAERYEVTGREGGPLDVSVWVAQQMAITADIALMPASELDALPVIDAEAVEAEEA